MRGDIARGKERVNISQGTKDKYLKDSFDELLTCLLPGCLHMLNDAKYMVNMIEVAPERARDKVRGNMNDRIAIGEHKFSNSLDL
jgi:hypothetical protein